MVEITFADVKGKMHENEDARFWNTVDGFTQEEVNAIRQNVDSWDEDAFEGVRKMFDSYFGFSYVPTEVLKNIIKQNLILGMEIYDGCETDTCVRDLFISAILNYVGSSCWPTYGDSESYTKKFFEELPAKLEAVGIKNRGLPNFA